MLLCIVLAPTICCYQGVSAIEISSVIQSICNSTNNTLIIIYTISKPPAYIVKALHRGFSLYLEANLSLCVIDLDKLEKSIGVDLRHNIRVFPAVGLLIIDTSEINKTRLKQIKQVSLEYGDLLVLKEPIPLLFGCRIYIDSMYTYVEPSLSDAIVVGNPNARIKVFIYEDLYCPFCAKLYRDVISKLVDATNTGVIAFVHKNFIVHPNVVPLHEYLEAMYMECHDPKKVFNIVMKLYIDYANSGTPPSEDKVKNLIKHELGKLPDLSKYLNEVRSIIQNETREAMSYGMCGTPGILVWDSEKGVGLIFSGYVPLSKFINIVKQFTGIDLSVYTTGSPASTVHSSSTTASVSPVTSGSLPSIPLIVWIFIAIVVAASIAIVVAYLKKRMR